MNNLNALFTVTDIHFTKNVTPIGFDENDKVEYVTTYNANVVINDEFLVQVSGDEDSALFSGISHGDEMAWNSQDNQTKAYEKYDNKEIESAIEAVGFENNMGYLQDNASEVTINE